MGDGRDLVATAMGGFGIGNGLRINSIKAGAGKIGDAAGRAVNGYELCGLAGGWGRGVRRFNE